MFSRAAIYGVLILAMILMTISPACKFITGGVSGIGGGQNFIEICAADGSVKRIALLDPNAGPLAPINDNTPATPHHMQDMSDCAFCFASAHTPLFISKTEFIAPDISARYLRRGAGTFAPLKAGLNDNHARAPPFNIVV